MKISVIGLGYVGLPLARLISTKGYCVVGVDTGQQIVDNVNSNEEFVARTELDSSDTYIVCVPTPLDDKKKPDLMHVTNACKAISEVLGDGESVLVESTLF